MLKIRSFRIEKLYELLKDLCLKESICWTERKSFPDNDTNDFVKSRERDEMVAFLLEACEREDMSLSAETFSLFVALLDRFLATYKVKLKYLECLAVACLYIASKVKEEDDKISITSEFLVECECKCSVAELLRMEQMVLAKFEWNVSDVTAVDFLHIYYAMLSHAYKQAETNGLDSMPAIKKAWKPLLRMFNSNADGNIYPPADLDFLESLESKLTQCLCVHDLTTMFKPNVLAFSLISLQMDKALGLISSEKIRNSLSDMLDSIKQFCKLSFELVDKCKEHLRSHLATVETNKTLFDNYFDEYYKWKIRNLKQSSIFVSPLAAVNSHLDVIEEEEYEDQNENLDIADESCDIGDYVPTTSTTITITKEEKKCEQSRIYFDSSKFMNFSYADILSGRKDNKRKLSENSNEDEEMN